MVPTRLSSCPCCFPVSPLAFVAVVLAITEVQSAFSMVPTYLSSWFCLHVASSLLRRSCWVWVMPRCNLLIHGSGLLIIMFFLHLALGSCGTRVGFKKHRGAIYFSTVPTRLPSCPCCFQSHPLAFVAVVLGSTEVRSAPPCFRPSYHRVFVSTWPLRFCGGRVGLG